MWETLRKETNENQYLLDTATELRDYWLDPIRNYNPKTVELTKSEEGILRLRGYVRDEKPDVTSLEHNAFVGIAFIEDQIIAEIYYPFSTRITSFISLDLKTGNMEVHELKDYRFIQVKQSRTLDESGKLETLQELTIYFERLTNFSIPYEEQYARDIKNINAQRIEILEIFKIKTLGSP